MDLVSAGAFQVIGYAVLRMLEALEHAQEADDGSLDGITREALEVKNKDEKKLF